MIELSFSHGNKQVSWSLYPNSLKIKVFSLGHFIKRVEHNDGMNEHRLWYQLALNPCIPKTKIIQDTLFLQRLTIIMKEINRGIKGNPKKKKKLIIKNIYGRKFQGLRNTGISTYKKEGKEDSGFFIAWNLKQALSSFDRRTTYLSLSGLKIWITHQSICIILYPGWGSEGLRWRKHGEDERGSAEVAVAGKWEVGDNFGWNTFCLVLGKMTHYWLSHERRIVNLWYCIKQILKRSFQMPKFQYPPIYYFSILNLIL